MKNIRLISTLVAALMLSTMVGCVTTVSETPGQYVDDSVITTGVKAAILNEPTLKVTEINVETFKGVVQLSGFVSSPASIGTAVAVARGVNGVKSVKNDLHLK